MQWTEVQRFPSSSKSGKFYIVKVNDRGQYGCSCPQYLYNRNGDRTCYHTEKVKVMAMERVSGTVSIPGNFVLSKPVSTASVPNEGPITEKPRQLKLEKKEE